MAKVVITVTDSPPDDVNIRCVFTPIKKTGVPLTLAQTIAMSMIGYAAEASGDEAPRVTTTKAKPKARPA